MGGDDLVADTDRLGPDRDAVGFNFTGRDAGGSRLVGQSVDGVMVGGRDHHTAAGSAGLGPGLVGGLEGVITLAGSDPAGFDVLVDHSGVTATESAGGLSFPGVGEAADGGQLGGLGVGGEEAEQAAGVD